MAGSGSSGLIKAREVEFKLGLGPCGRVVVRLDFSVSEGLLTVTQTSLPPELAENRYQAEKAFRASLPKDTVTGGELIASKGGLFGLGTVYGWSPVEVLKAEISESSKEILNEFKKYREARQEAIEIKTFIYKMTDVHGRIVTEQ